MTFPERLTAVRKAKGLSQADVGRLLDIKGDAYGRYERGEVKPSIEVATRIAEELDVSLDYLVGLSDVAFDQQAMRRIAEVSTLPAEQQRQVYLLLDALLRDFKARTLYEPSP